MFTGVCRCLQVLIGAYMDIDRCLKVLKVPTGAYRCLQVGTGGRCLVIFKSAKLYTLYLSVYNSIIYYTVHTVS